MKKLTPFLLAMMILLLSISTAEEQAFVENEWNYVDGSMDISGGIPETANGGFAMYLKPKK